MAGCHSCPEYDRAVPREINSTASPPEFVAHLRQVLRLSETLNAPPGVRLPLEVNPDLAPSVHPSKLPWCFVVPGHQWESPMTFKTPPGPGQPAPGWWKEKERTRVAIRDPESSRHRYVGMMRTLAHHESLDAGKKKKIKKKKKKKRTETGWVIVQYHCLVQDHGLDMVVEDKMTLCVVSNQKNKAQLVHKQATPRTSQVASSSAQAQEPASSLCTEGSSPVYTEEQFEDLGMMLTSFIAQENPIYEDLELPAVVPPTGSPVWMYLSKIYKKDPQLVQYAVCNECHRMLIGRKHGTSHLGRHPCTRLKLEEVFGPRTQ